MNKLPMLLGAALLCAGAASAQNDFDLSSQRGEIQLVNPVPGSVVKRSYGDIVISPQPQKVDFNSNNFVAVQGQWKLDVPKELLYAVPELPNADKDVNIANIVTFSDVEAGLKVRYGAKPADKAGVDSRAGAYILTVDTKGVTITGRDKAGAYYGLQTLTQMLDSKLGQLGLLPCGEIQDWPELPQRGIVEGFYGTPWSQAVRLSLIDFCGKNKLNTYVFGPKDDPYHSSPYWREPYPEDQAARIRELVEACNRNCVNFVWAIHPGKDIRWDKADRDSLVAKFEMMYKLGVRDFSVFFDDIEGIGTDSNMQVDLLNYLNREFLRKHKDVGRLSVCPTDYSRLWASPRPGGQLDTYGRKLDHDIDVFYTGDVVCSDLTMETLEWVDTLIRRPAYYWWNFPVTDYARNFLMQGPTYGVANEVTAAQTCGVLSNPMEHGEASKLALYSLADYTWNPAAYNPTDSWQRALKAVAGNAEAGEAYGDFAIHSADTKTGYRRDESWLTVLPDVTGDYRQAEVDALLADMNRLATAPERLRATADNKALLEEINPWLDEGAALANRVTNAVKLATKGNTLDDEAYWVAFSNNLMDDSARARYEAHTLGTLRLQPYYSKVMDRLGDDFFVRVSGSKPVTRRIAGTYHNLATGVASLMTDGDTATYYHSNQGQRAGDRIALDLGAEQPIESIYLLQGRKEGDVDYYDSFVIEASTDGENWTPITDVINGKYEYSWKPQGTAPVARYVRLKRGDSKRSNWIAVREFDVNLKTPEQLGLASADGKALPPAALSVLDADPVTGYMLTAPLLLPEAEAMTLLLSEIAPAAVVEVLDQTGNVVSSLPAKPITRVTAAPGQRVRVTGPVRVHEIIR